MPQPPDRPDPDPLRAEARSFTVRPVASLDELIRTQRLIAAQFPPRRSAPAPAHGQEALEAGFRRDPELMLAAERDGEIVGGVLALRSGDTVKVNVIALVPDARRLELGRRLMEAIERDARRGGARAIYLGGANADNRGFYWRLGYAGRRSLMQKSLPRIGSLPDR